MPFNRSMQIHNNKGNTIKTITKQRVRGYLKKKKHTEWHENCREFHHGSDPTEGSAAHC